MRFLLLGLSLLSFSAFGDAIVKGHSSGYCSTEILYQKDIVFEIVPHQVPTQECANFSGEWTGGCYDAVLGSSVIPGPDQVHLDSLRPYGKKSTWAITVKQEGCGLIQLGVTRLDFTGDITGQGHLTFRRSCEISGSSHASWERTIDLAMYATGQRRWEGQRAVFSQDLRGADPNYHAEFRQVKNWRLYHPEGDTNQLRLDYGYFQSQRNYDPKAFEFYNPSYGGQVCVWSKR